MLPLLVGLAAMFHVVSRDEHRLRTDTRSLLFKGACLGLGCGAVAVGVIAAL